MGDFFVSLSKWGQSTRLLPFPCALITVQKPLHFKIGIRGARASLVVFSSAFLDRLKTLTKRPPRRDFLMQICGLAWTKIVHLTLSKDRRGQTSDGGTRVSRNLSVYGPLRAMKCRFLFLVSAASVSKTIIAFRFACWKRR